MRAILQVLVGGVGVDGGHQAIDDAETIVENLRERREAVRGAGGVRDDVVLFWVIKVVVDTNNKGRILVGCRC